MSDSSSPSPGEVCAEQIAEVLAARYGLPGARVEIIPLGVETDNAVADTGRAGCSSRRTRPAPTLR